MSLDEFKAGISDQYQGEVTGEVAINCLLTKFRSPWQQYLLGTALQLETETKARLRPVLVELGVDIRETDEARQAGLALGEIVEALDWKPAMEMLSQAMKPYVDKYQEIADIAPPECREIAELMVEHERSIQQLFEQAALGAAQSEIDAVNKQLISPLPVLSTPGS